MAESHLRILHGGVPIAGGILLHVADARGTAAGYACGRGGRGQHVDDTRPGAAPRCLPELEGGGTLPYSQRCPSRHPAQRDLRIPLHPQGHYRQPAGQPSAEDFLLLHADQHRSRLAGVQGHEDHQHTGLCCRGTGHDACEGLYGGPDTDLPATHPHRPASDQQSADELQRLSLHDAHPRPDDAVYVPHHGLFDRH